MIKYRVVQAKIQNWSTKKISNLNGSNILDRSKNNWNWNLSDDKLYFEWKKFDQYYLSSHLLKFEKM